MSRIANLVGRITDEQIRHSGQEATMVDVDFKFSPNSRYPKSYLGIKKYIKETTKIVIINNYNKSVYVRVYEESRRNVPGINLHNPVLNILCTKNNSKMPDARSHKAENPEYIITINVNPSGTVSISQTTGASTSARQASPRSSSPHQASFHSASLTASEKVALSQLRRFETAHTLIGLKRPRSTTGTSRTTKKR